MIQPPFRLKWRVLRQPVTFTALILLLTAALIWPALLNGYPYVFSDSIYYIGASFELSPSRARPGGYALFLRYTRPWDSLWWGVVAQALVTAYLLVRCAWLISGGRAGAIAAGLGVIVLGSGIAMYTSWIMADVTTAWLFLCGLLWFLSRHASDRAAAVLILMVAVMSHNSHYAMAAAGAAALLMILVVLRRRLTREDRRRIGWLSLILVLSFPASVAVNWAALGKPFLTRGGPTFQLARVHEAGVLTETLDRNCAERRWKLCEHRDLIASGRRHADWFLWGPTGPIKKHDLAWNQPEHKEIVRAAIECCAGRLLSTGLRATWRQFWTVSSVMPEDRWKPAATALNAHLPHEHDDLLRSRQVAGTSLVALNAFEDASHAILVLVALCFLVVATVRRATGPASLLAGLFVFLALNAAIVGFAGTVHERYQGRIAYLIPYCLLLLALWPTKHQAPPAQAPPQDPPVT